MKKTLLATAALALTACAPTPDDLCNREAVAWDKWGTPDLPAACVTASTKSAKGERTDRIGGDGDSLAPDTSPRPEPRPDTGGPIDEDGDDTGGPDDTPGGDDSGGGGDQPGGGAPDSPDADAPGVGNPGNHKDVGHAGEAPNSRGDWGKGDKGMSQ